MLAASYRFKVLSLDQLGNGFMIMVDLSMDFEDITHQPGAMEALIVQNVKARFAIIGPTVYWRMDAAPAPTRGRPRPASQPEKPPVQAPVAEAPATLSAGPVRVAIRHDRLEADEVAAFRFA